MNRVSIALSILIIAIASPVFAASPQPSLESLKELITARYAGVSPTKWGENVPGVRTRLDTDDRVIALTLDACGSNGGKGVDARLVAFLIREQIPATLFINGRWIDANPDLFRQLAANPLFEIANHGFRHKPASVTGRSIYGIAGTQNVAEVVEEIELNARKIAAISGVRPKLYRSGTAYYDDIAVQISQEFGHEVAGYSLLGDAGATWSASQVMAALLKAVPGDIALLHMNHPEAGTGAGIMAAVPELKKRGFKFVRMSDYPLK
ncbi:MAG: polysaccharide deacetylase family protein [Desulfuromonadaceae bacterium]|nr:polysaccharide deacetylase family protein [Desulfuromonadaceae bacterium]